MSSASVHPAAGVTDASGVISTDLPCRKCGYNLRGLTPDGRCPECGTAVAISMQGDLLRFSDPAWLENLGRGASLILWGILLLIVASFGVGVLMAFGNELLGHLLILGAQLLWIYGAWLLTEPDPSGIGEDRYGTARKIIRISLVVGLGQSVIEMFTATAALSPEVMIGFAVVGFAAGLVGLVGQFALLYYLMKLAARIPDDQLAGRARFLLYAYGISVSLATVGGFAIAIVAMTIGPQLGAGTMIALGLLMIPVGLAWLVFAIMFLFLLHRIGKAFRIQAQYARQNWAGSEAHADAPAAGA